MTEQELVIVGKEVQEDQPVPYDLKNFTLTKILSNNTSRKTVVCLGTFKDLSEEDLALIILEKTAFTEENVATDTDKSYFVNFKTVENLLLNSEYGSFKCFPKGSLNGK